MLSKGISVSCRVASPGASRRCLHPWGGTIEEDIELETLLNSSTVELQDVVQKHDADILNLVRRPGGEGRKCVRDRSRSVRHLLAEIYSSPRVTAAAKLLPEFGYNPGFAFDSTVNDEFGNPLNFEDASQRRRAREHVERDRPLLLIGSPMCTAFDAWQRINHKQQNPPSWSRRSTPARWWTHGSALSCMRCRSPLEGTPQEHPAQACSCEVDAVYKMV